MTEVMQDRVEVARGIQRVLVGVRRRTVIKNSNFGQIGGQGGIRTHGRLPPTAVFKTAALNHSATCPQSRYDVRRCCYRTLVPLARVLDGLFGDKSIFVPRQIVL